MSNIRNSSHNCTSDDARITDIGFTSDCMTSRGGLALFSLYLDSIGLLPDFERLFGSIRGSRKGLSASELCKQIICYLVDGTSRHLTYFDELRADPAHAASIQMPRSRIASSHQVKRFLGGFSFIRVYKFRDLLQKLFLKRLAKEQPEEIVLGIDTMVMDNSEADVRHGVEPTYKQGIKGFQPF